MQLSLFKFLKNEEGKIIMASVNIFIVFLLIILNPFIHIPGIQLWMLTPFILIVLNLKYSFSEIKSILGFIPFIVYIIIHYLLSQFFTGFSMATFAKFFLFFTSFCAFLILIARSNYYIEQQFSFEKIINAIILIAGIYGTYQFIGRQFGWPFTFDEILRFRDWKIGGVYQISSFFEEPAFFSQFLIMLLFIQLFVFDAKYLKIIILIIANIIFTISVTGIASMIILLIMFYISRLKFKLKTKFQRKRIVIISSLIIGSLILVIVLYQSKVGDYINKRIEHSFVSKTEIQKLIDKQKVIGGSVGYDKSGNARVMDELIILKETINSKYAIFGHGVNYATFFPNRKMALNAFTEFVVRWGLIGCLLFLLPVFGLVIRNKGAIISFIFIALYFSIDGAIAKLSFWFLLALFLTSIRIRILTVKSN